MSKKKLFFQILIQSLTRRTSQVALVLLAIGIGTAAATTLINLTYDVESKMNRELRAYGANLLVIPRGAQGYIHQEQLDSLANVDDQQILGAAPYLYAMATIQPGTTTNTVIVAGIEFERVQQVSPYWQVQGNWGRVENLTSSMVGSQVAQRLGLALGDRFSLSLNDEAREREFTVSGIVTTGDIEDGQVFINLPIAQQATGLNGKVSLLAVSVLGGLEQIQQVARQIERRYIHLEARPLRRIALPEGQFLNKVKWMMLILTIIILLISVLCAMTTMIATVVERQPEIGLMKALGARHGEIISLFLTEASSLAIIGGLAGYAVGVLCSDIVGQQLFDASISPRPEAIPPILLIALLVCWAAAYAPIKRAMSIQPAVVLKGE